MGRMRNLSALSVLCLFGWWAIASAADELKVIEKTPEPTAAARTTAPAPATPFPVVQPAAAAALQPQTVLTKSYEDPLRYTLGPDDIIEIAVLRHPEFSGTFPINLEGKIQYKFIGDLEVTGLTKKGLEEKIRNIISSYVINPEVNVTITEYKSKIIYVLGEVGAPGKYYMRSDTIPVREAVVNAGLPTISAAMRRCQIITPSKEGKAKIIPVDLYALLYIGNLKKNLEMKPGDVLYVPATVMAKVVRVINPVTTTIGVTAAGPSNVSSGRSSVESLATK